MFKKYLSILLFFVAISTFAQHKGDTYKVLLHKPVTELTFEQVKTTMLHRLNEMRAEENRRHPALRLKPLKYSQALERAAFFFMDHKTKWFDENGKLDKYCHFDDDNNGVTDRYTLLNIKYGKIDSVEHFKEGVTLTHSRVCAGENVVGTNGSIYEQCETLRNSPGHWRQIIDRYHTHIGIAYRKEVPILICDFAKLK